MDRGETYSEIEKQLLKEGFVTPEDMATAHTVRGGNLAVSRKPLGIIAFDRGSVPPDKRVSRLSQPDVQNKIGAQAQKKKLITANQVRECRKISIEKSVPLSDVLVKKGYLNNADRKKLLSDQLEDIGFVKQTIREGLIRETDLEYALKLKTYRKSICEILYNRNQITLSELNHVFRKFSHDLKLGQILYQENLITDEQLDEALSEQAPSRQSLGKILMRKRWIAIEQLYFALSIQYNTPFQKLDGYMYYEKQRVSLRNIVGQKYASENQMIPLFQNANNLTLAVSNPANIWSMHGLKTLHTDLQMTCVLITDEKLEQLYALLYGEILRTPTAHLYQSSGSAPPDNAMVISDPGTNISRIKKMYEGYRYYQQKNGMLPVAEEEAWFYEFIDESYHIICNKFGCNRVQFRFEMENNHPQIMASPIGKA